MFFGSLISFRHTLAFRLTVWYAAIFTVSSCVAVLCFYLLITSVIRDRTDRDLMEQVRQFSTLLSFSGISSVKNTAMLEAQAAGEKKIFFRFLQRNGQVFSSSNMSYWQHISVDRTAIEKLLAGERPVRQTVPVPGKRQKVRVLYDFIGPSVIIQLGQTQENYARFVDAFGRIVIASTALLIAFAALIGWFMAKRALSGVAAVTRTARRISRGALENRVPVKSRGDEIDQLAVTFNRMLDRIEALVSGIKEMSDNIAHDLKSPITRIRGLAEVTLTADNSMASYEKLAASTIEECDRLLDMINTMLLISKTEAGAGSLKPERVDLAGIAANALELFRALAEDKALDLTGELPDTCLLNGDQRMLQRLTANLLDNAIKYTQTGGSVRVSLACGAGEQAVLVVADTGIGISADDLPHVFERFFRCDQSRSEGGAGLGLSLAHAITVAHGGDIRVESRPGVGTRVTVRLPAA